MKMILAAARKELNGYFGSPMALIFIAVFLAASLFTFFWVETFFARGVADMRPLITRVLQPLSEADRRFWEIANYAVALVALVAIGGVWRMRQRAEAPMPLTPMKEEAGRVQLGGAA